MEEGHGQHVPAPSPDVTIDRADPEGNEAGLIVASG
jgi:hypothetical protein